MLFFSISLHLVIFCTVCFCFALTTYDGEALQFPFDELFYTDLLSLTFSMLIILQSKTVFLLPKIYYIIVIYLLLIYNAFTENSKVWAICIR